MGATVMSHPATTNMMHQQVKNTLPGAKSTPESESLVPEIHWKMFSYWHKQLY